MVIVDVARINQVLLKLVAPARDTMPDGGHLKGIEEWIHRFS